MSNIHGWEVNSGCRAVFDLPEEGVGWNLTPYWLKITHSLMTVKFGLGVGFDPRLNLFSAGTQLTRGAHDASPDSVVGPVVSARRLWLHGWGRLRRHFGVTSSLLPPTLAAAATVSSCPFSEPRMPPT